MSNVQYGWAEVKLRCGCTLLAIAPNGLELHVAHRFVLGEDDGGYVWFIHKKSENPNGWGYDTATSYDPKVGEGHTYREAEWAAEACENFYRAEKPVCPKPPVRIRETWASASSGPRAIGPSDSDRWGPGPQLGSFIIERNGSLSISFSPPVWPTPAPSVPPIDWTERLKRQQARLYEASLTNDSDWSSLANLSQKWLEIEEKRRRDMLTGKFTGDDSE